ncbi:SCO3933 family regulatory protein [Streptomyces sp. DSM 41534]
MDVARLGALMCVVPPEPRVNRDTGEIRTDREGRRLYVVGVSVRQPESRRADVIEVVVSGESPAVAEGMRVRIQGLVAVAWEIDGRRGTSYRAVAITPAESEGKTAPVAGRAKSGGDG